MYELPPEIRDNLLYALSRAVGKEALPGQAFISLDEMAARFDDPEGNAGAEH